MAQSVSASYAESIRNGSDFSQENLIYTPEEMLSFDVDLYLQTSQPELNNYAEAIKHWSGRTTISPKILIALLVNHTGHFELEDQTATTDKIAAISSEIGSRYYANVEANIQNPEISAIEATLNSQSIGESKTATFTDAYFQLFPEETVKNNQKAAQPSAKALPPAALFQLPYPIGESWQTWGGTHTNTGRGSGPFSSLDFRRSRVGFGADTSNIFVVSASGGQAVRHSSCFVEILGPDGWSTTYYHLDNVLINTGQGVGPNTRLANYANNLSQSLCGGGMSNGPHLHFSLKRNGLHVSLDDVVLSGYTVKTGRSNYDGNCNFFYLDNAGQKLCNGTPIFNRGAFAPPPPIIPLPNLAVTDARTSDQNILIGRVVTASGSIQNVGTAQSAPTEIAFLISDDPSISISRDEVLEKLPLSALPPSASTPFQSELILPRKAGSFWLGLCVEASIEEEDLTNNCSMGIPMEIETPPTMAPTLLLLED